MSRPDRRWLFLCPDDASPGDHRYRVSSHGRRRRDHPTRRNAHQRLDYRIEVSRLNAVTNQAMGPSPEEKALPLKGTTVIELADEQAEYCGLLLAGLGATVVKVEPPDGSPTRKIGPFVDDRPSPEYSLYFWHYNREKQSIVLDLDEPKDVETFRGLVLSADVLLETTPREYLPERQLALDELRAAAPHLVTARVRPFGDDGPWADWKGSDLVHLALGGPMMNCGYDPLPDGTYDLPPIAPQMWHSYHIAGEQTAMIIAAALVYRQGTGRGQHLSCAVHEAVAKSTEIDLMSWVMRAVEVRRQTCRHAAEHLSTVPTISQTKDGRWLNTQPQGDVDKLLPFLDSYGMGTALREDYERAKQAAAGKSVTGASGRAIPGSGGQTEFGARTLEAVQRIVRKFTFDAAPWREGQAAGLWIAPLRRAEDNLADDHWAKRGTFGAVRQPGTAGEHVDVVSKWVSDRTRWKVERGAPQIDQDREAVLHLPAHTVLRRPIIEPVRLVDDKPPFALSGVRIFDFSWFLATAGGTRFMAALGAEVIKVEWKASPDSRVGAMAPVGGREARRRATGPLPGTTDPDMGGQFLNKNAGKRGISLNVRDPRGLEIARRLIKTSDIVAEGFSPGVLDRWGLGYDELRKIKPDIIYAQQTGMGSAGNYGRFRSVGPIAAAFAGSSEMSGLPEPAMPAGWGYSYLDWIGAYSFALAMITALHHRNDTGEGQWIDASQCETGLFVNGTAYLDWSVNGRSFARYGNRSPYKPAAPHGAYRCVGDDSWIAIACFEDEEWKSLCRVAGRASWMEDIRYRSLSSRLDHQDDLDAAVCEWTTQQPARELMERLQAAGVPAGVCQTAADRCDRDPQLEHLAWLSEVTGTKIGTWPIAEVPVRMSETPARVEGPIGRGAPCYGEDNEYVFGEILGMTKQQIADLAADGVI